MKYKNYCQSRVMERTIFTWDNVAWADLAWIPPGERRGRGTLSCKCAQAAWHASPRGPARSQIRLGHVSLPLQPSCTADKTRCVNKRTADTTRTQGFVRAEGGEADRDLSAKCGLSRE